MSEIEKMYENCNIKPKQEGYCDWDSDCPYPDIINSGCGDECPYWKYEDETKYPPFTAEKQLELIKWLTKNDKFHCLEIEFFIKEKDYKISTYQKASNFNEDFTETLASLINNLWQDLTEEEKQQVKGILE